MMMMDNLALVAVIQSWECVECGWTLSAPMGELERSLRSIAEHEATGPGHIIIKCSTRPKRRWRRRVR